MSSNSVSKLSSSHLLWSEQLQSKVGLSLIGRLFFSSVLVFYY